MAQAVEEKAGERIDEDNGFTVNYGKFSVVTMKEWGYVGTDDNYAYFLIDNASKEVFAVDPKVFDKVVQPRWEQLNKNNDYTMKGILNTHKHNDHSGGNTAAIKYFGDNIPLYAGECTHDLNWQKDHFWNILEKPFKTGIMLGTQTNIRAIHVPCHTRGHVLFHVTAGSNNKDNNNNNNENEDSWVVDNNHSSLLFTGDTMFVGGVGKFFEEQGTPGVEMQKNFELIGEFDENTLIYPGHEYAVSSYKFARWIEPNNKDVSDDFELCNKKDKNNEMLMHVPSTVGKEKKCNVFMRTDNKELQSNVLDYAKKAEKYIGNNDTWNTTYDGAKRSNEPAWYMAMLRLLKNNFRVLNGKF